MRYFDANCFLGQSQFPLIRSFATAKDLLMELDDIGIERAMVCHFLAQSHASKGNQVLMQEIKGYKRLLPCWILNPHHFFSKDLDIHDIFKQLKDNGIRMVRLQPGPLNRYSLHLWALDELLAGLAEQNIVLYIDLLIEHEFRHYPVPEYEWQSLYNMVQKVPTLNIILFSKKLAISKMQVMGILKSCPNVMLDISSFQIWRSTEILCEKFGPERLVFGSYMPYFDPSQFMVQIAYAQISDEAKDKIGFSNLFTLLEI